MDPEVPYGGKMVKLHPFKNMEDLIEKSGVIAEGHKLKWKHVDLEKT